MSDSIDGVEDPVALQLLSIESSLSDSEALLQTQPDAAVAILQPLLKNLILMKEADGEAESDYDPALGRLRAQKEHTVKHDAEKVQVHKASAVGLRQTEGPDCWHRFPEAEDF